MQQPPYEDARWRQRFQKKLLAWFADHGRALPWRGTRDPYAIWVSEIMLQQTTTQTVRGYYDRFLERFPTVEVLATADLAEVNRLWEGLGYYRRAAQMHRAACEIVEKYGGRLPHDPVELQRLPGIGRYTVGAILSIADDCRLPILEANTIRLHARLLAYREDPTATAGQKVLWQMAEHLLPERHVGHFNQALMDMGSLVCTPEQPHCADCPVVTLCRTAEAGLQDCIPMRKPKCPPEPRTELAVYVCKNGRILMQQAATGNRWAGLWGLPMVDATDMQLPTVMSQANVSDQEKIVNRFLKETGQVFQIGTLLTTQRHTVTRYRITLHVYAATLPGGRVKKQEAFRLAWFTTEELQQLPLHSTARKVVGCLAPS